MQAESVARSPRLAPALYRDQSADDLRLSLLGGDVDLSQFDVLDRACVWLDWIAIDARIIGASHLIRIDLGAVGRVHEILACGPVIADAEVLYAAGSGALPERVDLSLADDVTYRFVSETRRMADAATGLAELGQRVEAARRDAGAVGHFGLRHDFPPAPIGSASSDPPCTIAWLGLDRDPASETVAVETAHSYPNEGTVVFSKTRLARRAAGA